MAEAEKEAPAARIVSSLPRSKEVPIEWPVEFKGKVYEAITVRRISVAEAADYVERLGRGDLTARKLPSIDCPIEVWQALDADDAQEVGKAAEDFLPRGLRSALEALASAAESA